MTLFEETVGVVVLNECHHIRRVGVEVIEHQTVVHAIKTAPLPIGGLDARRVDHGVEREVHHRLQVTVLLGNLAVALPGGGVGRGLEPCFAHDIKVGIFLV